MKITWNNRIPTEPTRKPIVFVSSTVYDKKDMLDHIFIQLKNKQYDVRMSNAGTIPADSDNSAYQNCLDGVKDADFFIGIISPSYGSGIISSTKVSITHAEMRLARDLHKPRLMLVDERVKTIADFLNHLGFRGADGRDKFSKLMEENNQFPDGRSPIKNIAKICDIRSIKLYDEMLMGSGDVNAAPEDRYGNWIQEFRNIDEFKRYITTQFSYFQVMEPFEGLREAASLIDKHLPADIYSGGAK